MPFFSVLLALLSDRDQFIKEIYDGIKINTKIVGLLICSSIFLAIYGGLIGAISSWMQIISSAAKLPFLFLITLAICLPVDTPKYSLPSPLAPLPQERGTIK